MNDKSNRNIMPINLISGLIKCELQKKFILNTLERVDIKKKKIESSLIFKSSLSKKAVLSLL